MQQKKNTAKGRKDHKAESIESVRRKLRRMAKKTGYALARARASELGMISWFDKEVPHD